MGGSRHAGVTRGLRSPSYGRTCVEGVANTQTPRFVNRAPRPWDENGERAPRDPFDADPRLAPILAGIVEQVIRSVPPWQADAACREHPDVNFFPARGESEDPARDVCSGCLVRVECLTYALDSDENVGIWGGTSERQRRWARHHADRTQRLFDEVAAPKQIDLTGHRPREATNALAPERPRLALAPDDERPAHDLLATFDAGESGRGARDTRPRPPRAA
jgi:WhiB family transcriptional regulator, redox-sensing transcriptional regulator